MSEKPEFCTDEHLVFLDELRESGVTNMFGAGSYVERHFDLPKKEAGEILIYWMKSFEERHPRES